MMLGLLISCLEANYSSEKTRGPGENVVLCTDCGPLLTFDSLDFNEPFLWLIKLHK